MNTDTIAAIATAPGEGGIGIVRLSGPDSPDILRRVFRGGGYQDWRACPSHTIHYGHVVDAHGRLVDEVLVSVMWAPRSYTAEDVVEINGHGGMVALREILRTVLAAGARLAEPGEFTRRAFLNGRLDLAQAEAVLQVIRARTETGLELALGQLSGVLSRRVRQWRETLWEILARVEAGLDFPEADLAAEDWLASRVRVQDVLHGIRELLEGAWRGRIYREGVRVVLAGRPNVGKSSLLNALLRQERAIVTAIPGTTRDVIEESINLRGIPVRLVDTAGIRTSDDPVERLGVQRSREALQEADLVLVVVDASTGLTPEDRLVLEEAGKKPGLLVANKMDDPVAQAQWKKMEKDLPAHWRTLPVSALEAQGLEELEEAVAELVLQGVASPRVDRLLVTEARHAEALREAAEALELALQAPEEELACLGLRGAVDALGQITGETAQEDLLDRIFSQFCLGK